MAKKATKPVPRKRKSVTAKLPMGLGYRIARNLWWMTALAVFFVALLLNYNVVDTVQRSVDHAMNGGEFLNLIDSVTISFILLISFIMLGSMAIIPLRHMLRSGIWLLKLAIVPLLLMNMLTIADASEVTTQMIATFFGLLAALGVLFDIREMYEHPRGK